LWNRRLAEVDGSVAAAHVGRGAASTRLSVGCEYASVMKFIDSTVIMGSDKELSNVAMIKLVAKE
jgi:hypothetical protein